MLSKDEIYRIWAAPEALWSRWVKPVLFAFMDTAFEAQPARTRPQMNWVPAPGSTAIICDLPNEDGVIWGMQFARQGYRPIPLYNALPFPLNETNSPPGFRSKSTVNVEPILVALHRETTTLKEIPLSAFAPPAFLLDADRRIARIDPLPGTFDNRSVCFETDFPSAKFLLAHAIQSVVVVQNDLQIASDLASVLRSWQRSGIQVLQKQAGDSASPHRVIVQQPSLFRWLWYRIGVALGLRRGELGAFGGIVPSSSG